MWWHDEDSESKAIRPKNEQRSSSLRAPSSPSRASIRQSEVDRLKGEITKLETLIRQREGAHAAELEKSRQVAAETEKLDKTNQQKSESLRRELAVRDVRIEAEAKRRLEAVADHEISRKLHATELGELRSQLRAREQLASEEAASARAIVQSKFDGVLNQHQAAHRDELAQSQHVACEAEERVKTAQQETTALRTELSVKDKRIETEAQLRLQALAELDEARTLHATGIKGLQKQLQERESLAAEDLIQQRLALHAEFEVILNQNQAALKSELLLAQQATSEAAKRLKKAHQEVDVIRSDLCAKDKWIETERQEWSREIAELEGACARHLTEIELLKSQWHEREQLAVLTAAQQLANQQSEFDAMLDRYQAIAKAERITLQAEFGEMLNQRIAAHRAELTQANQAASDATANAQQASQVAVLLRQENSNLNQLIETATQGRLQAIAEFENARSLHANQMESIREQLRALEKSAAEDSVQQRLMLQAEFGELLNQRNAAHQAELTQANQAASDATANAQQASQTAALLRQENSNLNQLIETATQGRLQAIAEFENARSLHANQMESVREQLRELEKSASEDSVQQRLTLQAEFGELLNQRNAVHQAELTQANQSASDAMANAQQASQTAALLRQENSNLNQLIETARQGRLQAIAELESACVLHSRQVESLRDQMRNRKRLAEEEAAQQCRTLQAEFAETLRQRVSAHQAELTLSQQAIREANTIAQHAQHVAAKLRQDNSDLNHLIETETQERSRAVTELDSASALHAQQIEALRGQLRLREQSALDDTARHRASLQSELAVLLSKHLATHEEELMLSRQATKTAESLAHQAQQESASLRKELSAVKTRFETEAQAYRLKVDVIARENPPTVELLTRQVQLLQVRLQREAAERRKAEGALKREAEDSPTDPHVQIASIKLQAEQQIEQMTQRLVAEGNLQKAHLREFKQRVDQLTNENHRLKALLTPPASEKSAA